MKRDPPRPPLPVVCAGHTFPGYGVTLVSRGLSLKLCRNTQPPEACRKATFQRTTQHN